MNIKLKLTSLVFSSLMSVCVCAADQFVNFTDGDVMITKGSSPFTITIDKNDLKGALIATNNLQKDFKRVCGISPAIGNSLGKTSRIVIGTFGHSSFVDQLIKEGKIDGNALKDKHEKYVITTVDNRLVIAGSDKRGTVYGVYELSRQLGVSPWYYWADVPVQKHQKIFIKNGIYTDGEPQVRYRGLFLNDEWPALGNWAKVRFGDFNHEFYSKLFELILRLKGNYMWPAMWNSAFYADDPLNGPTADDMGVIIGTSHHEPMSRSQKEWHNHSDDPSKEAQDFQSRRDNNEYKWDYTVNAKNLQKFWAGGVRRNKNTEDLITIGMRGDGDMPMSESSNISLLQTIIADQRKIIREERGVSADKVPQVWALYKEVQDYYNKGMRVPEDITLLLCDNNWGSIRMLPPLDSAKRKGGYGIYYHYDYVGGPRSYRWLNVSQIQRVWSDMNMAYENGVDRLWIVNVGDLKPMEYPIQFWFDMAWNPKKYNPQNLYQHTVDFCRFTFGNENGDEAARLLNLQCKYAYRITPELMDKNVYSLTNYNEFQTVLHEFITLRNDAEKQYAHLAQQYKDSYMQLILFPVRAYTNLYQMYYAAATGDSIGTANYFKKDAELCKFYNDTLCGGKWSHMMDQTHIGYRGWDNPRFNVMPKVDKNPVTESSGVPDTKDVVSIEAEHYQEANAVDGVKWNVIPYFGKTLSGVTLLPTNKSVSGSSLTYRFTTSSSANNADVHILISPMLDYTCGEGIYYEISLDGCTPVRVDVMGGKKNISEGFFDSRRIIDSNVQLPFRADLSKEHELIIRPISRGIIFEKMILNLGGMKRSYLGPPENIKR